MKTLLRLVAVVLHALSVFLVATNSEDDQVFRWAFFLLMVAYICMVIGMPKPALDEHTFVE
jgi:hypothetical protein